MNGLNPEAYASSIDPIKRQLLQDLSRERYTQIVDNYLIPAFGGSLLTKLSPASIQQAYNSWETGGRI